MRESTEPQARALADLRNHLEHKYVKVHEMLVPPIARTGLFHDPLAHSIERSDLEARTLRLLQLVRSALIYLVLAMHREEQKRENQRMTQPDAARGPFKGVGLLEPWKDDWNA